MKLVQLCRRLALASMIGVSSLGMLASQSLAEENLRVVMHTSLRAIDPHMSNAWILRDHGYMVFDTLFALDESMVPQPQMVDTYSVSDDKMTWTFKLREGLTFHDGSPVTADDAIASIRRWAGVDSLGAMLVEATGSMVAVDELTFELKLEKPFGLVVNALAKPSGLVPFVMPKRLADIAPSPNLPEAIGSGPFRFVADEWQPGVRAVYEKFNDYKPREEEPNGLSGGKVAKVDRIEWISMGDAQTAMSALLRGEIDIWEAPPHDLLPVLAESEDVVIRNRNPQGNLTFMRMNWTQAPFDNVKIRQAVLHAIAQEDFLIAQIGDPEYYRLCGAVFGCNTPHESEEGAVQLDGPHIDKAKELLAEGGYNGEKVVILSPTEPQIVAPLAAISVQALRNIGMNVELQSMDWNTFLLRRTNKGGVDEGGWSIFHTAMKVGDLSDPIINYYLRGDGQFFGWPEDPEIEKLAAEYAAAPDAGARNDLALKAHARAYEMLPFIPLGMFFDPPAYRSNIDGFVNGPATVFWNVEKK